MYEVKCLLAQTSTSAPLPKRARHFFIGRSKATGYHLLIQTTATNYFRRELEALGAPGSLISCPACNSTLGPMPLSRASSSADNLWAAAIFAIVSPLRARTFVRLGVLFVSAVVGVDRRQLVNLTLLLGTTSLFVDLKSAPAFIDCSVATLTPVRFATDCNSSPGATEITRAVSRRSVGTRLRTDASCFDLPVGTRTM